jgi:RNA-binding protein 25
MYNGGGQSHCTATSRTRADNRRPGPPTGPAAQGGGGYGQYQQQQQGGYQQQQGGYQQQQGPPHWQQQQQQQPQQGFQQHPRHVGLGAPGAAANLPPPQNLNRYVPQANAFPGVVPSQAWNGEKFSLFVGSLADGLEDGWLERILGVRTLAL